MTMVTFPSTLEASDPAPLREASEPSASEVRIALNRVLDSPRFRRSDRLRRFLELVVEEKLAGRGDRLKEYVIAVEVYDRGSAFNPAVDTIVRVEARRLRATLQAYYDVAADPVRIEVPKGGYEPFFHRRAAAPEVTARPRLSSVVVLPFEDLNCNHARDSFCRGLTEEVVCALAQVDGLRVTANLPALASHQSRENPRHVGRALKVAGVINGSVRRAGNRLRITAQLIRTADGCHLWSRRFESSSEDAFAIQDEVAGALADACCGGLEPRPQTRPSA